MNHRWTYANWVAVIVIIMAAAAAIQLMVTIK